MEKKYNTDEKTKISIDLKDDKKINISSNGNIIKREGLFGIIYELDDGTLFKKFGSSDAINLVSGPATSNRGDIASYNVLKRIKNLKLRNTYRIYEICMNGRSVKWKGLFGYRMEYIKKSNKNLLDFDINYFINNYKNLLMDCKTFSDNKILISDFNTGNIIISDDRMVIIDCDDYYMDTQAYIQSINNSTDDQTKISHKLKKILNLSFKQIKKSSTDIIYEMNVKNLNKCLKCKILEYSQVYFNPDIIEDIVISIFDNIDELENYKNLKEYIEVKLEKKK